MKKTHKPKTKEIPHKLKSKEIPQKKTNRKEEFKKEPTVPSLAFGQYFVIDNLSAMRDYILHAPQMIKRLCLSVSDLTSERGLELQRKLSEIELSHVVFPSENSYGVVDAQLYSEDNFVSGILAHPQKHPPVILALDHIQDPRNLGAIVRTCAFYGVEWVLAPKDRQVLLTPASVASAQGGFATVKLVQVTNLVRMLVKLKSAGYWVFGTDLQGDTTQVTYNKFREDKKVLVLGNEEKGISQLVSQKCDINLKLKPNRSEDPKVQSLNVSVAAGILLDRFI